MIANVRTIIAERFRLEAEQSAPPSASGGQLARLKLGMGNDDGAMWRAAQGSDKRQVNYADTVLIMRDLTRDELEVCRMRYWFVERGAFDPATHRGGYETYTRNVLESDIHRVEVGEREEKWHRVGERVNYVPMLPVKMTIEGEEEIGPAHETTLARAVDEEASTAVSGPVDLHVIVRGTRATLTSYEAIGEAAGLTVRQVRSLLSSAHAKVRDGIDRVRGLGGVL